MHFIPAAKSLSSCLISQLLVVSRSHTTKCHPKDEGACAYWGAGLLEHPLYVLLLLCRECTKLLATMEKGEKMTGGDTLTGTSMKTTLDA